MTPQMTFCISIAGADGAWMVDSVSWPILVGVVLFACAMLTRLPWATELGSDFYTQLWWQRQFRRSKAWIRPQFEDSVIRDAATFYPPLPACLYARLPERLVVPVGVLSNYSADAISAFLIYALLKLHNLDPVASVLSSVLWLSLPILHPANARLIGLGSRTLGPLLHSIWLLGVYFALQEHSSAGFFVMILFGVFIILSSQMAFQSMILQATVISLAYFSPLALFSLFLSIAIVLAIGARDFLAFKLVHIRWYLKHGRIYLASRNNFIRLFKDLRRLRLSSFIYFVGSTTPGVILVGFIGLFPILPALSPSQLPASTTSFVSFCLVVTVAGAFGMLITLIGPFEVFGESERYLEYASPFILMSAILLCRRNGLNERLFIGLTISLYGIFANLLVYRSGMIKSILLGNSFFAAVNQVRNALQSLGARRIATSPMPLASKLSYGLNEPTRYTFLHVLVCQRKFHRIPWSTNPALYPYVDTRQEFLDDYRIDTVIIDRAHLPLLPDANGVSNLKDWTRIKTSLFEIFIRSPIAF